MSPSSMSASSQPFILPQYRIYEDESLLIGLCNQPTTLGHTSALFRQIDTDLFSLDRQSFVKLLLRLWTTASVLGDYYGVGRCALITEGGTILSVLPLHGLSQDWAPISFDLLEFHEEYPGFLSSKSGPEMAQDRLDQICSNIRAVSGRPASANYHYYGDEGDTGLFPRIIRGDLQQWRVWEDDHHVAFLTPFANSPGFTVLVPRKPLSSNIFSIAKEDYSSLVDAAHVVAGILKTAFGTSRCGMIFEGMEVDYAHVKLIPVIYPTTEKTPAGSNTVATMSAPYQSTYQGYVSSLYGPAQADMKQLEEDAAALHKMFATSQIESAKP